MVKKNFVFVTLALLALMLVLAGCQKTGEAGGICKDTDGGRNVQVRGTLTYAGTNYSDYCLTAARLREYYCSPSGYTSGDYPCAYNCSVGSCLGNRTNSTG